MTDTARAALVERMATVCGGNYVAANAALDIALEGAAQIVTEHYQELSTEHRLLLLNRANALRALKSDGAEPSQSGE